MYDKEVKPEVKFEKPEVKVEKKDSLVAIIKGSVTVFRKESELSTYISNGWKVVK